MRRNLVVRDVDVVDDVDLKKLKALWQANIHRYGNTSLLLRYKDSQDMNRWVLKKRKMKNSIERIAHHHSNDKSSIFERERGGENAGYGIPI